MSDIIKTTFAGGIWSDSLDGRVDVDRFQTSVKVADNFLVTRYGSIQNRPGTEYVMSTQLSAGAGLEAVLVPFIFSNTETYVLVFTELLAQFIQNGEVVFLNLSGSNKDIGTASWIISTTNTDEWFLLQTGSTAAPQQSPIVVKEDGTSIPEGTVGSLALGEWAYDDNDSIGFDTLYIRLTDDSNPNSKSDDYILADLVITTPYTLAQAKTMTYTQSFDTMYFADSEIYPQQFVRNSAWQWVWGNVALVSDVDPPFNLMLEVEPGLVGTQRNVKYRASVLNDSGEESLPTALTNPLAVSSAYQPNADVIQVWPSTSNIRVTANALNNGDLQFAASPGSGGAPQYYMQNYLGGDPNLAVDVTTIEEIFEEWSETPMVVGTIGSLNAGEWALGNVDSLTWGDTIYVRLTDGTAPSLKDVGYLSARLTGETAYKFYKNWNGFYGLIGETDYPFVLDDFLTEDGSESPKSELALFSTASDYPRAVSIFQQRLFWGGADNSPQTLFGSSNRSFTDYANSLAGKDDDSIPFAALDTRTGEIIHHMLQTRKLVVFTTESVQIFDKGSNSDSLTPTNVQYRVQSYTPTSESVPPLPVDDDVLFVHRNGKNALSMEFTINIEGFVVSQDITTFVPDLFSTATIASWAYQDRPHNLIWIAMSDGTGLVFNYFKEQRIFAWTRFVTDGDLESVVSIPEDGKSVVYFSVRRVVNGVVQRFIERVNERDITRIEDAKFTDAGATYDSPQDIEDVVVTATEVTVTITAHGYSDGDFVRIIDVNGIESTGADESYDAFNDKWYQVASSAANDFELEDLDGNALTSTEFSGTYLDSGECRVGSFVLTGLEHLEGKAIAILADGFVIGDNNGDNLVVASGQVDLTTYVPDQITGFSIIHGGLPFTSSMQTNRIEIGDDRRTNQTKKKHISEVRLRLDDSVGGKVGMVPDSGFNAARLTPIKEKPSGEYGEPVQLTGTVEREVDIKLDWSDGGMLYFRQTDPLPSTILAMIMVYYEGG